MNRGAMQKAITLSSVTKSYPARLVPALDEVDLTVVEGEFVALMGPSGSGKTTLLNLIGALDRPTSGDIEVFGSSLNGMSDAELTAFRRNTVGFVFQTFHLIPSLSVVENVITPMVADRTLRRRGAVAREALSAVGLAGKEHALPGQLSAGEQQRVAVARALVMRPEVLLADEPTGNLDAATGVEIMDLIDEVRALYNTTVILATHDPGIALRAERVVGLTDGRLVAEIYVRPDDVPETLLAKLFGEGSFRR